jgi:hypothetical protein
LNKKYEEYKNHTLFNIMTSDNPEIIQQRISAINYLSKNKIKMLKKFFFESQKLYQLGELFSDNDLHNNIEKQIRIIIIFDSLKKETQQFLTEIISNHCQKK